MSCGYADDGLERQLHQGFTGRHELLAVLRRELLGDGIDGCIILTGSSGTGKTAAVTSWVGQYRARAELVFCHFIRTQYGGRTEPRVIAGSLASQIEEHFPHLRNPRARPEVRLVELLGKVSAQELVPHGRRMVLVVDGLDERTSVAALRQVLSWLPRAPSGVRLLLVGRLRDRARDLEALCGTMVLVDLDDPAFAVDHEATVAGYWDREARALGLDEGFVQHAVRCAQGSILHATMLRNHIASDRGLVHRSGAIPRDVAALIATLWESVRDDRLATRALEILCAAREPLTLEQIGRVMHMSALGDLRRIGYVARGLLVETPRDGVTLYGLFHDAIRSFLVERLGRSMLAVLHGELADKLATWPLPKDPATRRYALRHAIAHRIEADDQQALRALTGNVDFLEVKGRELGIVDVEFDLRRAAEASAATGNMALHGELDRLLRTLVRESQALAHDAGVDARSLWDRVRQSEAPSKLSEPAPSSDGDAQSAKLPQVAPAVASAVIRRATMKPASIIGGVAPRAQTGTPSLLTCPPLLGTLGPRGAVTACAFTPDSACVIAAYADCSIHILELDSGRQLKRFTGHRGVIEACVASPNGRWLVSASADHTLKLWNLESGSELATLAGHAGPVRSCAVTPDGSHVVSASADHTVKVWSVRTGSCTATFEGHTASVEDCAVSPNGRWVVSASADTTLKFWDLEDRRLITTYTGHIDAVTSCAVAPDSSFVVSGSSDQTLKIWNLDTGNVTTTLKGHTGQVTSSVFAVNSRLVYSASLDATVRIWDVDTGDTVASLEGHTRAVTCCAITPNGRRLVSGSSDSTLRLWALDGTRTATLHGDAIVRGAPGSRTIAQMSSTSPKRILFLAAKDTDQQIHARELRAIERELQMSPHGGDFELCCGWPSDVHDLARYLLRFDPTIIHLRGARLKPACEVDTTPDASVPGDSGIWLCDEHDMRRLVTGKALKKMVRSSARSARLVVLNACYVGDYAKELCQVVDCVVGMTRDHDRAALSFAVALYRSLGHRKSVGEALDHAVATLAFESVPGECVRSQTLDWKDVHGISLSPDAATP
jgi:hypothetical protein